MAIEDNEKKHELGEVLQQVSGQLRSSLNNIYRSLERIAPPELRDQENGLDVGFAYDGDADRRLWKQLPKRILGNKALHTLSLHCARPSEGA